MPTPISQTQHDLDQAAAQYQLHQPRRPRPQRRTHAELALARRHRNRHHRVQARPRQQQRQRGEYADQPQAEPHCRGGLAHDAAHAAQMSDGLLRRDLRHGLAHARLPVHRVAMTAQREAQGFEIAEEHHDRLGQLRQRHVEHRLQRLEWALLPSAAHHADDTRRVHRIVGTRHADHLAHRVTTVIRVGQILADDGDPFVAGHVVTREVAPLTQGDGEQLEETRPDTVILRHELLAVRRMRVCLELPQHAIAGGQIGRHRGIGHTGYRAQPLHQPR